MSKEAIRTVIRTCSLCTMTYRWDKCPECGGAWLIWTTEIEPEA